MDDSIPIVFAAELEVKFYIDGDLEYPTICGTGTEDYFGGSWSFAKQVNGKTVEQNYNTYTASRLMDKKRDAVY